MHQSIPAAPSTPTPPSGLLWGIFPPCQFRGVGHLQILCCSEAGHLTTRAFDMHAVSHQNLTTQRILLEKQADWLICQGWEKTEN